MSDEKPKHPTEPIPIDDSNKPDPEIEVELEEEPAPEKPDDVCVHPDEKPLPCGDCDYTLTCRHPDRINVFKLTQEPTGPLYHMAVEGTVLFQTDELRDLLSAQLDAKGHRDIIDRFKAALIRYAEINPTKGLDACASAVIYLQLMLIPHGTLAVYGMQLVCDCLTAWIELRDTMLYSMSTTPLGVKPN